MCEQTKLNHMKYTAKITSKKSGQVVRIEGDKKKDLRKRAQEYLRDCKVKGEIIIYANQPN